MNNYQKNRENIKTGDIVLFSGEGFVSAGIQKFTGSKWSHVGMVVKFDEWDFVQIWESTTLSDVKDLVSGKFTKGVQLVPLSMRIDNYEGDIAVRHLAVNRSGMIDVLSKLRHEFNGTPYEESEIELIKSAYDGLLGANERDVSSLFCSELVAEAYMSMGLLSKLHQPSNEYTPADFGENGIVDSLILNGAGLSEEIYISS